MEVDAFVSQDHIQKHMTRHGGILFHKSRIIDGQRWSRATSREPHELLAQGINLHTPVVDRWSPLAYSIWIHREVSNHAGFETALRHSLNYCFILQGHSLFEELGRDCMLCTKLRVKFLRSAMGPRHPATMPSPHAPAFWIVQANLFGPVTTFVPGREQNTRATSTLTAKCWVMVFSCLLSKAINLQVEEGHSAVMLAH
jgi:hypothetical protein